MAAVTRKAKPRIIIIDPSPNDPTKVRFHARAEYEFKDTGEVGTVEALRDISKATADGVTYGQIKTQAKMALKTALEGLRGKTNTVTEED